MIDLDLVRSQPEVVRASQRARGADPTAVDRLLAADEERRAAVAELDGLRAQSNAASREVRGADPAERPALVARARERKEQVGAAEAVAARAEEAFAAAQLALANVVHPSAPVGGEEDFTVLRPAPDLPAGQGPVRDHLELADLLEAVDVERGAKVSGSRFAFLTGVGALLELALVQMATVRALAAGCVPVVPPVLVRPEAMAGTGFMGEHADEVYRLERDDLYLVGTSEVPLAAFHTGEVLETLPRRYAGFSSCFRREAGSHGRDTRGIIRVHQFDKVEMFSFVEPDDADDEHARLLAQEEGFLADLELPYRVIDIPTGDLAQSQVRKFDCEVWLPSQERFLELTSASSCTDFQARRLGVRSRDADGRLRPVATLNGTLCAVQRTVVALLETHQRPDGSVAVPAALQPHLTPLLAAAGSDDVEVLRPVARRA